MQSFRFKHTASQELKVFSEAAGRREVSPATADEDRNNFILLFYIVADIY